MLLHSLALRWLADAFDAPLGLQAMADPMFTRLVAPETPPAAPAAEAPFQKKVRGLSAAARAQPPRAAASAPIEPPELDNPPSNDPVAVAEASPPAPAASAPQPAASAATSFAGPWPPDTRVSYALSGWYRGELTGNARVQWQRDDDRYQVRIDLDLGIFSYNFLSQGEVGSDALLPRAYQESTSTGRVRSVKAAPGSITLQDGRVVPAPPGVQDTASQFVELSHRFSTGRDKLEVGGTASLWLARPGGVDAWVYDIVGRENIRLPGHGEVEAFHLKPRPLDNPRGNFTAEMWYAPTLQFMPVRIRINQGSDSWVDLTVDRIEQR